MMKTGRQVKGQIEGRSDCWRATMRGSELFLFGISDGAAEARETVLILSAVSLNSTELMSFLGS